MTRFRTLTLGVEDELHEGEAQKLVDGLDAYSNALAPGRNTVGLWIVGRDGDGEVQAGLRAVTFYDWM